MEPRATIDPYVNELFMRNRDTIKPWVEAIPSSHIYVADLPDDLQPGTYTLTVKATDEFGRHHHAHKIPRGDGNERHGFWTASLLGAFFSLRLQNKSGFLDHKIRTHICRCSRELVIVAPKHMSCYW